MQVPGYNITMTLLDKDIREPLFDFLELQYGEVRFLEEKNMGRSRADILMVLRDAVYGIEIKSDADTYARLARQVRDYNRFCDCCIAAVGVKHAYHIAEHIPDWWGIITVDTEQGRPDFYIQREAQPNPKRSLAAKLSVLWRPELAHILAVKGLPKYKEKSAAFVRSRILEKIPEKELHGLISAELFERDYTTIAEEIASWKKTHGR